MSMTEPAPKPQQASATALKEAVREARIAAAERSGVVVDLRDAELARLEILNDALEPVFAAVPIDADIFDRGIAPGAAPRLWIDMLAHVSMGRDKRIYRFLQDTRYGRRVLAESPDVQPIVEAVTRYIARRLVERERALASDTTPVAEAPVLPSRARRRWGGLVLFILGMAAGAAALFALAWFLEPII